MRLIPLYTFVKSNPRTTKNIQSTPDGQIDLILAALMNRLKVLQTPRTPRVRNRDRTPFS